MKNFITVGYSYNELSETAKEKVKQWYLDNEIRTDELTETFEESFLNYFLPNSELKIQWSLASCQGDGVNIYGTISPEDIIVYVNNYKAAEHENKLFSEKAISSEDKTKLEKYFAESGVEIEIPMNDPYFYDMSRYIEFAEDIIEVCEECDENLLRQFEKTVRHCISALSAEMEAYGYDYLYEVSDEEVSETCEANEWYFTENGKFIG